MKKIKKEVAIGIVVIACLVIAFLGVLFYQTEKTRNDMARHIAGLGRDSPPETIEGLKTAIKAYEKQIENHVSQAAKIGIYWKILASRLQDRSLHNEALEALEQAIYYTPEDPALHYLTGISAGIAAKSQHDFVGLDNPERQRLFVLSEDAYLRAIELDPRYLPPRYGLAVLYIFELDRPEDAIPHLLQYLEISKSDTDAMFLLASAYYMTEAFEEAVAEYDKIIRLTKDEEKRTRAQDNRQTVLGRLYG
ncbi:MAG: tetratricopeptide repeat protein [Treponema sp.]|jgi:tetratricopeptide (TPR) repeat protein|nr:tetratricopeptide repeat protein [Treponema sp.]